MHKTRFYYGTVEPELTRCRTSWVGATIPGTSLDMYYCLNDNADCSYARAFGFDYVCKHADNHTFVVLDGQRENRAPQTKREQVNTCSRSVTETGSYDIHAGELLADVGR